MTGEHVPPKGVSEAAERAIRWIDEGRAGAGLTAVGAERARQLASGEAVDDEVIARMRSYLARHQHDADAEGFHGGGDGFPSLGRVAWDAWGGDAGRRWAQSQRIEGDEP